MTIKFSPERYLRYAPARFRLIAAMMVAVVVIVIGVIIVMMIVVIVVPVVMSIGILDFIHIALSLRIISANLGIAIGADLHFELEAPEIRSHNGRNNSLASS